MIVWHYTNFLALPSIIKDGRLIPMRRENEEAEPLLWFVGINSPRESINFARSIIPIRIVARNTAPQAIKKIIASEQVQSLAKMRFGINASDPRLEHYTHAWCRHGIAGRINEVIHEAGAREGFSANRFMVTKCQIPIDETILQVERGGGYTTVSPYEALTQAATLIEQIRLLGAIFI